MPIFGQVIQTISIQFLVVPSKILPISDSRNDNELEHCDDAQCHIVCTYHYILWLFEMHILEKNYFFPQWIAGVAIGNAHII